MKKSSQLSLLATTAFLAFNLNASPVMIDIYNCYTFGDSNAAQKFSDSITNKVHNRSSEDFPQGSLFKLRYFLGSDSEKPPVEYQGFSILSQNPETRPSDEYESMEFGSFITFDSSISEERIDAEGEINLGMFGGTKYKITLTDNSVQTVDGGDVFGRISMVCNQVR